MAVQGHVASRAINHWKEAKATQLGSDKDSHISRLITFYETLTLETAVSRYEVTGVFFLLLLLRTDWIQLLAVYLGRIKFQQHICIKG